MSLSSSDTRVTALSRLQSSLHDKEGLVSLIEALAAQTQEVEDALLLAMPRLRGLIEADAGGPTWLQDVAKLVGANRDATESDAVAITYINGKIEANVSRGMLATIYKIASILYPDEVFISECGDLARPSDLAAYPVGSPTLVVESQDPDIAQDLDTWRRIRELLRVAKPAGVSLVLCGVVGTGLTPFRFDTSTLDGPDVLYTVEPI